MTILLEDGVVCLVSRDHAKAGSQLTVADYLNGAHIVPLTYSVMQRGVVESHMAALRLHREATVTVPYFSMAPSLLPGTDLIFTTSRHFAEHYARQLPLTTLAAPIDFPAMRFYQLWHNRTQQSQSHAWLRSLLSRSRRRSRPAIALHGLFQLFERHGLSQPVERHGFAHAPISAHPDQLPIEYTPLAG